MRPVRIPWRSARNDGDGSSSAARYWPGRMGWAPYTASAGEKSDPSLQADRIPNITHGKCVIHLSPAARARRVSLKGQCHEIFDFWFFSRISFPQAPECTIRVVSNFFENSRRYSQLKVCHRCQRHRWQMRKIFNQISFNYLVWTPFGSIVNL